MAEIIINHKFIEKEGKIISRYIWKGTGTAKLDALSYETAINTNGNVVTLGDLRLRIVGKNCLFSYPNIIVVKDGWKYHIWKVIYPIYTLLEKVEMNIRLTLAIWGLIKCGFAEVPIWKNLLPFYYFRTIKKKHYD